jgi:hypothetical protein
LVFSCCGKGTVIVAREETADKLAVAQTLTTQPGARTLALDPATHKIYLAAGALKSPAGQSSGTVPGGIKILVYGTDDVATPSK